jgi:hypothetical protein
MKNLAGVFFLLIVSVKVDAQDCTPWFPFDEGVVFEYSFFDKKDKPTGRLVYEVKEIKKTGDNYLGMIASTFYDKKDKEFNHFEFEVSCTDGVYKADLSNFLNPSLKEAFGTMEITVTGDPLEFPRVLKVGTSLPDAKTHMEAAMGIINIKMDMEMTNRKVVEKVAVTTPLKTFDAYKITADEYVKMPVMSRNYQSVYYFAEGYGQVKVESYDKNGKLDSYMLLSRFEKP